MQEKHKMSEKITHPESHKAHEALHSKENHERLAKHHEQTAEQAKKELSEVNLGKLREQAKTHAESATHKTIDKHLDKEPGVALGTQYALKASAYEQTLRRVRKRLSKPDKVLSKVVHNKTVDALSNVGAQTIARPSGVLGGSICAFLGSVILLYTAKHYGFRYNYLALFLLFITGYLLGSLLELIIWSTYSRKRRY
jgi:hypothetical protein